MRFGEVAFRSAVGCAALGLVGCGSTAVPSSARPHPVPVPPSASQPAALAGLPVGDILQRARAADDRATSFTMSFDFAAIPGAGNPSRLSGRLSWARGGRCAGHVVLAGRGSAELIVSGATTWLKPDSRFARTQFGPAAAAALSGKYLKGPTTDPHFAALLPDAGTDLCRTGAYLQAIPDEVDEQAVRLGTATVAGVRTIELETVGKASGGDVYIATEGTPYLVKSASPDGEALSATFTDYGKPVTVVVPPQAQTIDVGRLPSR